MSVASVALKDRGTCSSISQYTVDGKDLTKLKKLVTDIMVGDLNNPDDGLQDIYANMQVKTQGQSFPPMALQTAAASQWIDQHGDLYKQLKRFGLQPEVSECRSSQEFCDLTDNGASPDLYANMVTLVGALQQNRLESLTYYIYGQAREKCKFFGMHEGMLVLNLKDKCQG